jgi:hypothetical protein
MAAARERGYGGLATIAGAVAIVAWLVALALAHGAYHVTGWGTLSAALVVALASALVARGTAVVRDRAALLVAGPLAGISLLAAASMWWTWFSPHRAWLESGRFAVASLAVLVGAAWLGSASRRLLLVRAIAVATLGTTIATAAWLATAPDDALSVLSFGKAAWPIGNSNAQAVWLLVGTWCALACTMLDVGGASRDWRMRAAGGGASVAGWVFVLAAESAGSLMAWGAACACLVVLGGSSGRRLVAWSVASGAIAWLVAGRAVDQLHAAGAAATSAIAARHGVNDRLMHLHDQAVQLGRITLAAAVAGAIVVPLLHAGIRRMPRWQPSRRTIIVGLVLLAIAGVAAAVGTAPGRSIAKTTFSCPVPPPPDAHGFRAKTDVEYDFRCDYWRVAIHSFAARPVQGWGADSFHGRYMLDRRGPEQPREPHSLPLQLAGDLGIGAFALLAIAVWGLLRAHLRMARSAREVDRVVGAASLGAVATWFAHSTLDFTFNVLAVTLPVLLLAGAVAAAPERSSRRVPSRDERRRGVALAVLVVGAWAVLVVPQVLAARALHRAEDPERARGDAIAAARRAAWWDPTWAEPHLVEGFLRLEQDQPDAASAAAHEAERLEPNHWAVHVSASRIHRASGRTGRANASIARALELNPQLRTGA